MSFPDDMSKPVCVFCASSPGESMLYTTATESLGAAMAAERIPLIYGGGRRGLMGVVSRSVLEAGGRVHGVLPRALMARAAEATPAPSGHTTPAPSVPAKSAEGAGADLLEDTHEGRLSMEVVGSMHERKAKMARLATGGFVVLPGGYGTFEELLEMVTWNQIGMHSLPIIVLNIGNFYTPLLALIEGAVDAGFIKRENLALLRIVDLGDAAANKDESRATEWGAAAITALKEWSLPTGAGYGFKWEDAQTANGAPKPARAGASSNLPPLFSTGRYVARGTATTRDDVPLWDLHVERIKRAHDHFSERDGDVWGTWPGEEAFWAEVERTVKQVPVGDYRLRMILHPGARIEVQAVPAPADIEPFGWEIAPERPRTRRKVYLDPAPTANAVEKSYRLHKTLDRAVYDAAAARVPGEAHPEVLMHDGETLLETVTSNIAIQQPSGEWITPRLEDSPFLAGTMRRRLLSEGALREGTLTVEDWERAKREARRIVGFNGFRGVWEGEFA